MPKFTFYRSDFSEELSWERLLEFLGLNPKELDDYNAVVVELGRAVRMEGINYWCGENEDITTVKNLCKSHPSKI